MYRTLLPDDRQRPLERIVVARIAAAGIDGELDHPEAVQVLLYNGSCRSRNDLGRIHKRTAAESAEDQHVVAFLAGEVTDPAKSLLVQLLQQQIRIPRPLEQGAKALGTM